MSIRTIETVVKIAEDRKLIVQLPVDFPVGVHRVVTVLEEAPGEPAEFASGAAQEWTFPILANATWPADMPMTREEMYDEDGR
jgi:hypothetical protein